MTEEEAKRRWCPFSRVISGSKAGPIVASIQNGQAAFNRIETGPVQVVMPDGSACIGSCCMAWREEIPDQELAETDNEFHGPMIRNIPPPGDGWINQESEKGVMRPDKTLWRRPKPSGHGYCGLAGPRNYR